MSSLRSVVVSRADRLGDLLLSLPAVHHVQRAFAQVGQTKVYLHVSEYCQDIADLAVANGVCGGSLVMGDAGKFKFHEKLDAGLALVHSPLARTLFARCPGILTVGPRTRLNALWWYRKSVAQHRSKVMMSEMEYNLELAEFFLRWLGVSPLEFVGLPPLKVPSSWASASGVEAKGRTVFVVSNRGSAQNWPIERYCVEISQALNRGTLVDALCSGADALERAKVLKSKFGGVAEFRLLQDLPSLRHLVVYLSTAEKVISSSTGPLHLAHALGIPVHGVFPVEKKTSFRRWRPCGYWHEAPVTMELVE